MHPSTKKWEQLYWLFLKSYLWNPTAHCVSWSRFNGSSRPLAGFRTGSYVPRGCGHMECLSPLQCGLWAPVLRVNLLCLTEWHWQTAIWGSHGNKKRWQSGSWSVILHCQCTCDHTELSIVPNRDQWSPSPILRIYRQITVPPCTSHSNSFQQSCSKVNELRNYTP